MLEKRDVIYYRRLSFTQLALGAAIIAACFVTGVAAKYHTAEIHIFTPYWVAFPLIIQGFATLQAARSRKRWPLAIWLPFFFIFLIAACSFLVSMVTYKVDLYKRYPCFVQRNYKTDETRCTCSYSTGTYFTVNGASDIAPCIRALDIMLIMGNVCFMLIMLSLIPQLLMFVLACNDLCCVSCRRAALVPQVVVTGGQPGSFVPVQSQTVTFRTDEQQPGSSQGGAVSTQHQAPPLPRKTEVCPEGVPCSF